GLTLRTSEISASVEAWPVAVYGLLAGGNSALALAMTKTLPVMVAVVEQLRGALGESGLLIIIDSFLVNFWSTSDGSSNNVKVT
uniref:Uncharacterized protein n=1 Tax=Cucumis melo TaxID=3656 RepID=A0A9I9EKA2_CUCME